MNVCEEAMLFQEKSMLYGHSDQWTLHHLNPGEKLYQLDMGHLSGGFFIDEETYNHYLDAEKGTFDVKQYCNDAEICPYFDGTYKNHISEYEIGENGLDVAYGTCAENTALGTGGCSQIYVAEDDRDQLERTDYNMNISDEDRTIGREKADQIITAAVESNLPALGLAPREEESMQGLFPEGENAVYGNEQAKDNSISVNASESPQTEQMSDLVPPDPKEDKAYNQPQQEAAAQENNAEISR